jgi:starvation-inducible DNA-binding protein
MVKTAEKQVYKTKNDLPEAARIKVIDILNSRLADAFDLYSQAKQAHWNVKGPNFIALHELFDQVASSATEWVDLIAERAVQLGGIAEGTARTAAERSSLSEYPLAISDGHEHVEALSNALSAFGSKVRQGIDQTAALQDADTADIFTEISRSVDKYLWFVEAHLQARP